MEVQFYSPHSHMRWLVNQYESIHINGKADIFDKFIPRQDASIVFHFKDTPFILHPVAGQLPQYFIAPVVSKANLMRIRRQNDTFVASCKPTVLSRILNITTS